MTITAALKRLNAALERHEELTDIKAKEILKPSTVEKKKNGADTNKDTLELCDLIIITDKKTDKC